MKKIFAFALTLSIILTFTSCGDKKEVAGELFIPVLEEDTISYNTVKAEVGSISQDFYASGEVGYPYVKHLSFTQLDGVIGEFNVKKGDTVKKGEVVATLKSEDIEYEASQQQLKVDSAYNTYQTLKKNKADKNDIDHAFIDYEVEESKLLTIKSNLSKLQIVAPFDGMITFAQELKPGDKVSKQDVIVTITDESFSAVLCSTTGLEQFNATYGTPVKLMQGAIAEADGIIVDTISNSMTNESLYVIKFDKGVNFSDIGAISVLFTINRRDDTVIVPSSAVKSFQDRTFVNVLINGSKVEFDVQTGVVSGDKTEIISGLTGGEDIIVNTSAK